MQSKGTGGAKDSGTGLGNGGEHGGIRGGVYVLKINRCMKILHPGLDFMRRHDAVSVYAGEVERSQTPQDA